MSKFPGPWWDQMLAKQREVEHRQYIEALKKDERVVEIARWIGQSGYWKHVHDKERQWQRCLTEADGLVDHLRAAGFSVIKQDRP